MHVLNATTSFSVLPTKVLLLKASSYLSVQVDFSQPLTLYRPAAALCLSVTLARSQTFSSLKMTNRSFRNAINSRIKFV